MTYVVTLELDPDSFAWLNDLRRRHFPPERNFLDAHLTLFHKLDDAARAIVEAELTERMDVMPLMFAQPRSLGRGVAIEIVSNELAVLHRRLALALAGRLTAQDAQPFRPHVTIQNKVAPATATALLENLRETFAPRAGRGTAVLVWRYLGGPWQLEARLPLDGNRQGTMQKSRRAVL